MSGHLYARLYNRDREDRVAAPAAPRNRRDRCRVRDQARDPARSPRPPALDADRADAADDQTLDDDALDLGDDELVVS